MFKWLACMLSHRSRWVQRGRRFMGGALYWCPICNEHRSDD